MSRGAAGSSGGLLPAVGAAARLHARGADGLPGEGAGEVVGTRVDDVRDGRVAVHAPPPRPGDLEPPADGTPFVLCWTDPRGTVELPVVLRERVRSGAPLWWLEPAGAGVRDQRRRFVRAAAAGPLPVQVELQWELPAPGRAALGLADLSEGGLRARSEQPSQLLGCSDGTAVAVRLTVSEVDQRGPGLALAVVEHELGGTVIRVDQQPDGTADVVIHFHEDARQGDALRALVFSWQRSVRRS